MATEDALFAGSIPELYERFLVPLIFDPYAEDLIKRIVQRTPARVLELAAGTGVVTRKMSLKLPSDTQIVATDLNQGMIEQALRQCTAPNIEWRLADAMELPFPDASFDLIVCQFGVMFFPDKARTFAEARRVLKPGGTYLFNVWDTIARNEFAGTVHETVAARFPADPPRFLARTPYGYHDVATIKRDLAAGGFASVEHAVLPSRSHAPSARIPATAFCQATPLRAEIEARGDLDETTGAVECALERRFGNGIIEGQIQALVFTCGA
jgi:ubiquinone/menaquinone biosynthesis C-methylase UbiE